VRKEVTYVSMDNVEISGFGAILVRKFLSPTGKNSDKG
jgi:hypothetical protein